MSFETALAGNEQLYNMQLAIVPKKQTDLFRPNGLHDVGYTSGGTDAYSAVNGLHFSKDMSFPEIALAISKSV